MKYTALALLLIVCGSALTSDDPLIAEFEAAAAEFDKNVDAVIASWARLDAAIESLRTSNPKRAVTIRGCSTKRLRYHDLTRLGDELPVSYRPDPGDEDERCRIVRITETIYESESYGAFGPAENHSYEKMPMPPNNIKRKPR